MNITLHEDAFIVEILQQTELVKKGSIIISTEEDLQATYKVVYAGDAVKDLIGKIIVPKKNMGEEITIEYKKYLFFPYGKTSYYYIINE